MNVAFPAVLALGGAIFGVLLSLVAIFLILLVLVQRGRGGGLAGALGGMGGSSAFGAKAGDVFTRITIVAAAVWIILCIAASRWGSSGLTSRINVSGGAGTTPPAASSPLGDDEIEAGEEVDSAPAAATGTSGAAGTVSPATVPGADTPASATETPAAPADSTDN